MEKIGNYGVYQNSFYEKQRAAREMENSCAAQVKETKSTKKTNQVTLSEDARNLLKELKKTYGNMDFIVADYESDEEAAGYLSRGTNDYSVLLTPEELEKMAADESVKNQNLDVLNQAVAKLEEVKGQLGDKADVISRFGIVLGEDGEISFFAELEKTNEKQRERIEEKKQTTVFADSVEKLAEKIGQIDWSRIKEEDPSSRGQRFDFTV